MKEKVERADLILTANISLMFGSRIKELHLENVEVLRGKLPVGKKLVVTLIFHPLVWPVPELSKHKFIFFLARPNVTTDDAEVRPLIGEAYDQDGLELATDANLEKVREAIRLYARDSK